MKKRSVLAFLGSLSLVLVMMVSSSVIVHAQQPIKLRMSFNSSPTSGHAQVYRDWFKRVEQATKGRVEFVFYPNSLLGPPGENYAMIKSGMADLGGGTLGFFPEQFPLSEVIQLPFLGLHNAGVGSRVYWGLYEKFPELRAEYQGVKVITFYTDSTPTIGTNKPIRTMEDIKRLKIRAPTGSGTEFLKALGAVPLFISPSDIYTAMERKVVDGWIWSWEGCVGSRLTELTDYFTSADPYFPGFMYVISLSAWNKLSPDIQKIFEENGGAAGAEFFGKEMDRYNEMEKAKVQAMKGKKVFDLPPEEMKRWKETCKPIQDKWVANMEAKGLPGKAILQEAQRLGEKYAAEYKK